MCWASLPAVATRSCMPCTGRMTSTAMQLFHVPQARNDTYAPFPCNIQNAQSTIVIQNAQSTIVCSPRSLCSHSLPAPAGPAVLPLEGVGLDEWLVFERVMVVRDLYTGGKRTFQTQADAQQFRALMYQQYGELSHASISLD